MSQSILNEEDQLLEQPSELDSATSNTSSSTNNKANKASASGHNSVLSESTEKWAKIKQLASRTEGLLTAHQDRLRKTLIAMLRLGQVLQENDLVKGFYSLQSIEYGKKAKINLFHGIVSAAFSWEYPDEKKSKYRQILLYALTSGMSEIEFQERLKADFNNCYAEAVKFLRVLSHRVVAACEDVFQNGRQGSVHIRGFFAQQLLHQPFTQANRVDVPGGKSKGHEVLRLAGVSFATIGQSPREEQP